MTSSVVLFDKVAMLLRESKKLLLKQREVTETFVSGREHSSVFRPATVRSFATDPFPQQSNSFS